ncbi:MAG: PH domain-containing protein [Rhodothermales bacterium]|nr:PH domain-containing protein [Rhodothermales bacterium]
MTFRAPWDLRLTLITVLALVLLVGVGVATWFLSEGVLERAVSGGTPLAIVLGALACSVRGYRVAGGRLHVLRLGWTTTFPLDRLRDVRAQPGATAGSIRTFGNGGLFAFVGRFRNGLLGPYRAFVTDPARAVVLEFEDRTVVVTPDDPAAFVAAVQAERGEPVA